MKIEFKISLETSDFFDLGGDDFIDNLWTHQKALDYLLEQGYEYQLYKDLITDKKEADYLDLRLIYSLKPEEMTQFLLKFPKVLSTYKKYETVRIYD